MRGQGSEEAEVEDDLRVRVVEVEVEVKVEEVEDVEVVEEVEVEVVVEVVEVVWRRRWWRQRRQLCTCIVTFPSGIIRLHTKRRSTSFAQRAASAAVGAPGRADASATGVGVWKISIARSCEAAWKKDHAHCTSGGFSSIPARKTHESSMKLPSTR